MFEMLLMFSIAFLVPLFISKVYDLLMMSEDDKKNPYENYDQPYLVTKHLYMIVISCILIIIGLLISSKKCNWSNFGIGLGGFLLLLKTILTNWSLYGLKEQIIVIGISLVSLIFIGSSNIMTKMFCMNLIS